MLREAIEVEAAFADDVLSGGALQEACLVFRRARCASTSSTSPTSVDRARAGAGIRQPQPVPVHGPAGRAGADQFLRAPGVGLSGRDQWGRGVRGGVLAGHGLCRSDASRDRGIRSRLEALLQGRPLNCAHRDAGQGRHDATDRAGAVRFPGGRGRVECRTHRRDDRRGPRRIRRRRGAVPGAHAQRLSAGGPAAASIVPGRLRSRVEAHRRRHARHRRHRRLAAGGRQRRLQRRQRAA